jgi:RecA/RadA recombinase
VILSRLMYVQASSVEFVLETIEELLGATDEKLVLIWDSLAFTPAVSDVEGDFNPQSSMAMKARILAKGMSKLTIPIADKQATFIVLNQLKTNIPTRTDSAYCRDDHTLYHPRRKGYALCLFLAYLAHGTQG